MRTVVLGPNSEIESVIARRQTLGQDRYDEVWEGEYHMNPGPTGPHAVVDAELLTLLGPLAKSAGLYSTTAFNLGDGPPDYRVPDGGLHRERPTGTWIPTAAIVVEIVSPGDETYAKFGFYAAHGVEEIIVADPAQRTVKCFRRLEPRLAASPVQSPKFVESEKSDLLGVYASHLTAEIDWP